MIIMDRTRRLRMNATLRDMVRENHVRVDELIYPVFVTEENDVIQEVPSMPGICQYSLDHVLEEIGRAVEVGIKGILLFGIPVHKDEVGSEAYDEKGVVCRAIRLIKDAYPELVIMADVCLCEYTSHGHCGLVKDGIILNDETLPLLAKASVAYAKAGADIIAPSDMMDKRVEAIRNALDEAGAGLIKGLLDELKANGSLIIIACHDTEELNYLSDEIYEIYDGEITGHIEHPDEKVS